MTDSAAYDDDDLASLLVARGLLGSDAVPRASAGELATLVLARGLVPRKLLESVLDELARYQFRCRKCKTPFAALPHTEPRRFPCPRCKKINVLPTLESSSPATQFESGVPAPATGDEPLPARFGRYAIEAEIARGAMGIVYRAHHDDLPSRPIALKVLQAPLASDRELLERFKREAQALARIDHANVVRVHDAGTENGVPWFAMELVKGKTLEDLLDQGPLEARRAAALVEPVARAVAHLHSRGILHRDLKLGNVLVAEDGTPKLSDFGLARLLDRETRLTADGDRLGTPLYMAPEQVLGSLDIDGRADVYSIGVMFFRLITKSYPFLAKSTLQLYAKVLAESATWPEDAPADPGIRGVCERAFARDPENRYPTALALARDLEAIARGGSALARAPGRVELAGRTLARQRRAVLAVASVVVLLVVIGLMRWSLRGRAESDAGARLAEAQRRIERFASGGDRRAPSVLREELAAVTSCLAAARAAGANVTELEEELRSAVGIAARGALGELAVVPGAARAVARGRPPYDPEELRALEEVTRVLLRGRPGREDLERTRFDALLLAGRPREARAAGTGDPAHAALLAGAPGDAAGDRLARLVLEPASQGSLALRVAEVEKEEELWKKADLGHVGDGADAVVPRVLLGERLLEREAFASAAFVFELALGRGRRDAWNGNPRALWSRLATEPHAAEVSSGVRATGPLGAFAILGRARARAELEDAPAALAAAEEAVAALESAGPLAASARLLLARARRAGGELELASRAEEAARLSDDGALGAAIEDASRRTALLGGLADVDAGEDDRTLDLVADARAELACGSPTIDAREGDARALAAARRLAGLALERSPGSRAALAVFARAEAALGRRAQAVASRAVERAGSPDALEALAMVLAAQGNPGEAESRYDNAAKAVEKQGLRLLAADHEIVLLRRRAAAILAAANEPKRALSQLEHAIDLARCATPAALEVLHREAAGLRLSAETIQEHQRLEGEAYAARTERQALERRILARLAPIQRGRVVGQAEDDKARSLVKEFAPPLEDALKAGFADGWLLCCRRELDALANVDPSVLYGERALALECEPEVFETILTQTASLAGNFIVGEIAEGFSQRAADAVRKAGEHRAFVPHGTDPDFEEALALTQAGMLAPSPPRVEQGIRAARRYVRRHPAIRAGRLVLARLLLEARAPGDALVELERARRLPGILGSRGMPPGALDVTRAEIAVLEEDAVAVREALEAAKANGIQLFPWWFDAKRGGPFAGQGLPEELVERLEGRR